MVYGTSLENWHIPQGVSWVRIPPSPPAGINIFIIFKIMEQEIRQPIGTNPIEWEAEEFETHARDAKWYIIVSCILLLILAYTIWISHWILSAVVVMVGIVLYLSGRLKPRIIKYIIDNQEVKVGDKVFKYNELKTFWFSKADGVTKLNLISTFRLMPVISIRIQGDMKEKIKDVLGKFLPEAQNRGEDWIDRINRFLKI